jgi:hypothetical protein
MSNDNNDLNQTAQAEPKPQAPKLERVVDRPVETPAPAPAAPQPPRSQEPFEAPQPKEVREAEAPRPEQSRPAAPAPERSEGESFRAETVDSAGCRSPCLARPRTARRRPCP